MRHLGLVLCLIGSWAVSLAAETVTVRPVRDDAMLLNPGKGWVQYYGTDKYTDEVINIGYTRCPWSVVEPEEGKFDWSGLDGFIKAFKEHGKKVAFGVINFDGGMGRTYSIPKWVFDDGAVPLAVGDGSTPTKTLILPKTWDDPVYLAKMKEFIAAFAARYDGNPDVAWIDIRDYGNSGECNGDFYGLTKNTSAHCLQYDYFAPYIEAFRKTQLIVPWTAAWFDGKSADPIYEWAVSKGVGMRRDGICSQWSKDGSETLFAYGHEPIVFEYGNTWADTVKEGFGSPEALMSYIKAGKPSYLQFHPELYEANRDFCQMLGNKIGYHFILQQATVPRRIKNGAACAIEWKWLNDGVAPIYTPCHVAIALLDQNGRVVQKQWLTGCDPKSWKSDEVATENVSATFSKVPSGTYQLAVGLFLDDKDADPVYRLGIKGRTAHGWYVLYDMLQVG